jgi:hypothetical protein
MIFTSMTPTAAPTTSLLFTSDTTTDDNDDDDGPPESLYTSFHSILEQQQHHPQYKSSNSNSNSNSNHYSESDDPYSNDTSTAFSRLISNRHVYSNHDDMMYHSYNPDVCTNVYRSNTTNDNAASASSQLSYHQSFQHQHPRRRCIEYDDEASDEEHSHSIEQRRRRRRRRRQRFILTCGTCLVLYYGFIWSSYSSDAVWFHTVLTLTMPTTTTTSTAGTTPLLPNHNTDSDAVTVDHSETVHVTIHSNTLLSLLQQQLKQQHQSSWNHPYHSHSHASSTESAIGLVLLVLSTLMIPCLSMVILPIAMRDCMVQQHQQSTTTSSITTSRFVSNNNNKNHTSHHNHTRSLTSMYELTFRGSFLIIYIVVWIIVCNHFIVFHMSNHYDNQNNTTTIATVTATATPLLSWQTQLDNGIISYTIGVSCAMMCIVLIRSYRSIQYHHCHDHRQSNLPRNDVNHILTNDAIPEQKQAESAIIEEVVPFMQILEEQAEISIDTTTTFVNKVPISGSTNYSYYRRVDPSSIPFCKILLVFQCGLLSILFMVASLVLPLLQLNYDGLGTNLMVEQSRVGVHLYEIPWIVYNDTRSAQSSFWMIVILIVFIVLSTVLFPLYAIVMATMTWMLPSSSSVKVHNQQDRCRFFCFLTRKQCRTHLQLIHPVIGSIVVSISLLLSAQILQRWNVCNTATTSTGTMNHWPYNNNFQNWGCSIHTNSSLQTGAWCYIIHSILLEVVIVTTVRWS